MAAFPSSLSGFDINVRRAPFYVTRVKSMDSGKEQRSSRQSSPRFRYTLSFNGGKTTELSTLLNFFDSLKGKWDIFQYTDPYDAVTRNCRLDMDEWQLEQLWSGTWGNLDITFVSVL